MPQGALSPRKDPEMLAQRELFPGRIEQVIPWGELIALVEPHDPLLPGRIQARMARSRRRLRCGK
jgi:hypothetical protein